VSEPSITDELAPSLLTIHIYIYLSPANIYVGYSCHCLLNRSIDTPNKPSFDRPPYRPWDEPKTERSPNPIQSSPGLIRISRIRFPGSFWQPSGFA
jgi:hypothetical protein